MTVSTTSNKIVYSGDGVTTSWSFSFPGIVAADVQVYITDTTGAVTQVAANAYTVALNAAISPNPTSVGGSVTYPLSGSPLAAGNKLTILRTASLTQPTSLSNQGTLLQSVIETALDNVVLSVQQLNELLGRQITVAVSDSTPAALPATSARANLLMGFDGSGNPIATSTVATGLISSAMASVVSAATLAIARNALGLGGLSTHNANYGLQQDVSGAGFVDVNSTTVAVAINQAVVAGFHFQRHIITGPVTYTLAKATTLWNGFGFWGHVIGGTGVVTFTANAADTIEGGSSGGSTYVAPGYTVWITTDGVSKWYIEVVPLKATPPQGYLTLTSATPIIAADVIAATSVFYTPYAGQIVPIYDGVSFRDWVFAELTLTLNNPNHAANTLYDVFAFNNAGVITLATGPAWTTTTAPSSARGTGAGTTQLSRIGGLLVNTVQITGRNGATTYTIPLNQATYLGTIYTDGTAGQVTCHRSLGQNRKWGVWNYYNRAVIEVREGDPTASWVYTTSALRASNAAPAAWASNSFNVGSGVTSNGITVLQGVAEEQIVCEFLQQYSNAGSSSQLMGIGVNSIAATTGTVCWTSIGGGNANQGNQLALATVAPTLGLTTIVALENGKGVANGTWYGTEANMSLRARWRG